MEHLSMRRVLPGGWQVPNSWVAYPLRLWFCKGWAVLLFGRVVHTPVLRVQILTFLPLLSRTIETTYRF